jgi:hypothetical protein
MCFATVNDGRQNVLYGRSCHHAKANCPALAALWVATRVAMESLRTGSTHSSPSTMDSDIGVGLEVIGQLKECATVVGV